MDCQKEIKDILKKIAVVHNESHWKGIDIKQISLLSDELSMTIKHCVH